MKIRNGGQKRMSERPEDFDIAVTSGLNFSSQNLQLSQLRNNLGIFPLVEIFIGEAGSHCYASRLGKLASIFIELRVNFSTRFSTYLKVRKARRRRAR
jgi:hypothetical protein